MKAAYLRALELMTVKTHKPEVEGSSPSLDTTSNPLFYVLSITFTAVKFMSRFAGLWHTFFMCAVNPLKAAKWYQLDLKLPIELRRVFFNDSNLIAKSFLDFSWINDVEERDGVLFIIEGALMYMEEQQVKGLLRVIGNHFTHSLVAFDTIPKSYVNLRKHQSINMDTAPFNWGNYSAREVERWHLGLHAFRTFHYGFSFNLRAYYGFKVLLMKCD